jgi:hypothetical protein
VNPGETVSVTLSNPTDYIVRGEIGYDTGLLRNASNDSGSTGTAVFDLDPGASMALVLRALSSAAGQSTEVTVSVSRVATAAGAPAPVQPVISGSGRIEVRNAK